MILGGVTVPYEKGLLGHSDADVLVHAVMDALLGAAALGDIGQHFPDTDPAYKGISSIELLKHVGKLLEEKGYVVENIDATVIAQRPKPVSYTHLLRECGLELPKHTFYVDNIFVYQPLPHVKTMYYLDVNFYRYYIGREDQSVNESVMIGRIDQQIRVTKLMLDYYDVTRI